MRYDRGREDWLPYGITWCFYFRLILWLLLKKMSSVLKVMKSGPVGGKQGKMEIQLGISSVRLSSREALQHRILLVLGHWTRCSVFRIEEECGFRFFWYTSFVYLIILETVPSYRILSVLNFASLSLVAQNHKSDAYVLHVSLTL